MEKISFDESTYLYKANLNLSEYKEDILRECYNLIDSKSHVKLDGYTYLKVVNEETFIGKVEINTKLDFILQKGIEMCTHIFSENREYSYINLESWVNVVRSKNPSQDILNERYHSHTVINSNRNSFLPDYTFVYYIQMPNNLVNDEGVLYLLGKNNIDYTFLPEEGDLIVMKGNQLHGPNVAPNSNIDRYVLAGNIEFRSIKNKKTVF
jgi:hypothetical protein